MDILRCLHRGKDREDDSFKKNACEKWLYKFYLAAQPPVVCDPGSDHQPLPLKKLMELEPKLFFPRSAVLKLVTSDMLEELTKCECWNCASERPSPAQGYSGPERDRMVQAIAHSDESKIIVAALLYTDQISHLYRVYKTLAPEEGIDALDGKDDIPEDVKERIKHAKALFKPERISLDRPSRDFPSGTRLPFLSEGPAKSGSFGTVSKVEVHREYLNDDVKSLIRKYAGDHVAPDSPDFKFFIARKMIQGTRGQNLENTVQMERDILGVIRQQKKHKENLIDLIAFYTFGDEINILFPYVEMDLHDVLYKGALPPSRGSINRGQFPEDWISRGIIGMAGGLCTIHHPQIELDGKVIFGFHFDLKPRNVLITRDGIFKITDFGQALIKVVRIGTEQYGGDDYRGGDPEYAAPESMPARHLVAPSYAVSSSPAPQRRPGSDDLFKYDIWSLACIMVQLYTFLCFGTAGVESFDKARERDSPGVERPPYYSEENGAYRLNHAVNTQLTRISFYSPGVESPAFNDYMDGLRVLMSTMLNIGASARPTSAEVVKQLEKLLAKYLAAKDEPSAVLVEAKRDELQDIPEGYHEIATDRGRDSFVTVEGVKMVDPDAMQNPPLPCRIRLFQQKGSIWMKVWFKRKSAPKVETDSRRLPLETVRLQQPALLKGEDRGYCRVVRVDADGFHRDFYFESGLLDFHAAFTQHIPQSFGTVGRLGEEMRESYNLKGPLMVSASLRGTVPRDLRPIKESLKRGLEAVAVQRWQRRALTYVHPQRPRSSSENESALRLMIFFGNPAAVMHIPLIPRLGVVEVERGAGTTTLRFGGSSKSNFFTYVELLGCQNEEGRMNAEGFLLPTRPASYPYGDEFRQEDLNTSEVKLVTPHNEVVSDIETLMQAARIEWRDYAVPDIRRISDRSRSSTTRS